MRHQKHRHKLAVAPAHRKSLMRNLSASLIQHGVIKTTHAKAKAVQPFLERLVTLARVDTLSNRRLAFARLNSKRAVRKLFGDIAPRFKERKGGYTSILKLADMRVGDSAKMSCIRFVDVFPPSQVEEEKASS